MLNYSSRSTILAEYYINFLYYYELLVCKKMTTYEYIMQNRVTTTSNASLRSDVESAGGEAAPPPMRPLSVSFPMIFKLRSFVCKNPVLRFHHFLESFFVTYFFLQSISTSNMPACYFFASIREKRYIQRR